MASKIARCLFVFILSALTSEAKGSIPVPRNLTATFVDPNQIHVSWQAPENVSKAFLGYNVILSSAGVTIVNTTVNNTSVSWPFELRDVCKNYTVGVAAHTASKQIGNYSSVVLLEDCGPPKIYTKEFTMYAKGAEDVIIPCNHTGLPQPSVYWLTPSSRVEKGKQILFDKDDKQIGAKVIKLMENGSLSISFTDQGDSGNYTCYVNNSYGNASNTVTLKVFEEFAEVRFEVTLTDEVFHEDLQDRSSTSFQSFSKRFTKEVNEVLTGLSNDAGTREVEIINIRKGSVIVDFKIVASFASANPNKEISSEIWSLILNSANNASLGNLTVSKIVVQADPPPPQTLQAIDVGKDHVTIEWSAPAFADNFQISGYSVQMKSVVDRSSDYTEVATASKDQRAVEVKDLKSNSAYLFRVFSRRPGGYRPGESQSLEVKTKVGEDFTEIELRDLFNEVNRMAAVGNHPNVVSLYGACSDGGPLWIVVKFAENGCLLNYLQKHRKQVYSDYQNVTVNPDYQNVEEGSGRLNYVQKLQLARGIAKGMQHQGCILT